ncbi:MAG: bifunctional adenosylcobinamide kinase/adenosylcobinamide-phosphate guanylyltransferase [Myxococcota bacterium]|nr:bifunctional adenosylcobinamide kinase/adenosylcobinamide-phosphate guanylyltransferase [Myxococcota bacterium]
MSPITLLTGGARSGKSTLAVQWAIERYSHRAFIATATACDDEMSERIKRHREERGALFHTIEEPIALAEALHGAPQGVEVIVVDCLTVWLGNLLLRGEVNDDNHPEIDAFLEALRQPPCDLILVTNEVGMGLVPMTELGRRYRDLAGRTNQRVANLAHSVIFMVSGLPMYVKGVPR